ncbi:MAG: hypothetical protein JSV96_16430 [Candidatus Aminicenantes bacterium]|nr:MAG: hypothetical protein JSV96_16430 [Candidatus Aminicenantes bacterium]
MSKFLGSLLFLVLLFFFVSHSVLAAELLFFYEKGCPYSAKINDFLHKRIRPNYTVEIKAYEIHSPESAKLMIDLARAYGAKDVIEKGVPAVFIDDKAFHGSSRIVQRKIEEAIRAAIRNKADSPLSRLPAEKRKEEFKAQISLPVVIGAAAANTLNPCSGAVLVILLSTILVVSKSKKAVLGAGFSFTTASFISYFLMGIGLFTVVQGFGIQRHIYIAVSILAISMGFWKLKDFLWKGQGLDFELPKAWKPLIKRSTSTITPVVAASFIGFSASLFLLPCTSGPYIVIIGMLGNSATRIQAVWLLLLYNTIFILPFIIITLVVGLGFTTTARVDMWRQERLRRFHLITGIFMLILGIMLILLLISGTI